MGESHEQALRSAGINGTLDGITIGGAKFISNKLLAKEVLPKAETKTLKPNIQLFGEKGETVGASSSAKCKINKLSNTSPKGLIGHDFEDYLTNNIGGNGSFSRCGREFDGAVGTRWWEAKSGQYWDMLQNEPRKLQRFKEDMGDRLRIAKDNGATYELFSNTPIPNSIKEWLTKKGIPFTELLK